MRRNALCKALQLLCGCIVGLMAWCWNHIPAREG